MLRESIRQNFKFILELGLFWENCSRLRRVLCSSMAIRDCAPGNASCSTLVFALVGMQAFDMENFRLMNIED